MSAKHSLATLAWFCSALTARPPEPWMLARSERFEVYSDAGNHSARSLLTAFERMHAFFARQAGVSLAAHRPVRIISFGSRQEYDAYRLRSTADAYYLGTETRDYIVIPAFGAGDFHLAAHEYGHLLIHAGGLALPHWIAEGIAEVASTVQIREQSSSVGGDLPARSQLLRRVKWMNLSDLFTVDENAGAGQELFYAQSWALTSMLMLSPEYGPRFPLLLGSLASGVATGNALSAVYHTPVNLLMRDLQAWMAHIPPPVPLPGVAALPSAPETPVSSFDTRSMLADLRFAAGDLDQAEALYRSLAAESRSAEVYAALGLIALRKADAGRALAAWQRAMELGLADARLCYHYAILADQRGLPADQVRSALERAIRLQPEYDDARFTLALMEKNASRPLAAIDHLRAMRTISPSRAFTYWMAMADAQLALDRRSEARAGAAKAREYAVSDAERLHVAQLIYMADTDLSVQMTSGADGRPHFETVRVPHDQPPGNPFIESGDGIQRAEATLSDIECAEAGISVVVTNPAGRLSLSVPEPSRVQIRNIPGVSFEFTCGPQTPRKVTVEFTAAGVLRGIELQ